FRLVFRHPDHPLRNESELPEESDGRRVVGRDDRGDPADAQRLARLAQGRRGRLPAVALRAELRKEGKAQVRIGKVVPAEYPADADRRTAVPQGHEIETVSMPRIARGRPVGDPAERIVGRADSAVSDEAEERRVVE